MISPANNQVSQRNRQLQAGNQQHNQRTFMQNQSQQSLNQQNTQFRMGSSQMNGMGSSLPNNRIPNNNMQNNNFQHPIASGNMSGGTGMGQFSNTMGQQSMSNFNSSHQGSGGLSTMGNHSGNMGQQRGMTQTMSSVFGSAQRNPNSMAQSSGYGQQNLTNNHMTGIGMNQQHTRQNQNKSTSFGVGHLMNKR